MKILFTHHRYHTNLFNWFRGFQQNGHKVRLLVYKPDEVSQPNLPKSTYLKPSKWSTKKMKSNPRTRGDGVDSFSPFYYPSFKSLYKYFKQERPDLVVIRPVFSRYAYMVLLCTILFRAKRVFYSQIRIHKAYPKHKLYIFNFMMWLLNAHWISPCLGDQKRHPKAPSRMFYFPFAMPPLTQTSKVKRFDDEIRFLTVAKYFKSKNPKLVLEVFLDLCENHDNIRLTICGSGDRHSAYFQMMNEIASGSKYKDRIQLLINQSYSTVQSLYETHDVFILPSKHDPAAITNLEAMAYGMPVVCSKNNGTAQYTIHGENGYLFDINKREILRTLLESFLSKRKLITSFSERTLEVVKTNHHPKVLAESLINSLK